MNVLGFVGVTLSIASFVSMMSGFGGLPESAEFQLFIVSLSTSFFFLTAAGTSFALAQFVKFLASIAEAQHEIIKRMP